MVVAILLEQSSLMSRDETGGGDSEVGEMSPPKSPQAVEDAELALRGVSMHHPCALAENNSAAAPRLPSDEGELSTTDTSRNDLPSSVAVAEEEEVYLSLHSPNHRKSPIRGVLRAVSSITITDIEAFEEGISVMMEKSVEPAPSRIFLPTTSDAFQSVPLRGSVDRMALGGDSNGATATTRPRRGATGRRRRAQAAAAAADSDDWYLGDLTVDEVRGATRLSGEQEDNEMMLPVDESENLPHQGLAQRRKSLDLLPNVPKRVDSATQLARQDDDTDADHDSDKHEAAEEAKIQRLIQCLHGEIESWDGPKSPPPNRLEPIRRDSIDILPDIPPRRTSNIVPPTADRFDRFNSDAFNILTRHQSMEGILSSPFRNPTMPPRAPAESESEQEGSPFKVREFVVSLDDLEEKKTRGDMPKRRRSFDALPTPPRRFFDEFSGLDTDDDDDDDDEIKPHSRRSFDNIANDPSRHSPDALAVRQEDLDKYGYNVDLPLRRSQHNNNCGCEDGDKPARRLSSDILPSLPRRRLPSDTSSDDEDEEVPLKSGDDVVRRQSADFLPNAPRRTESGLSISQMLRTSSGSLDGLEDAVSASPVGASAFDDDLPPQRLRPSDTRPALPIRDFSIPDIDIDNSSSDGGALVGDDTYDTSVCLETDLESEDDEGDVAPKPDKLAIEEQSQINQDQKDSQSARPGSGVSGSKVEDSPTGDSKAASACCIGDEEATDSGSQDNDQEKPSNVKLSGRRKEKSNFLLRLFPARN